MRGTGLGSHDEVETYHDRIRETVVNMLTDDRRRELHGFLAHEMEAAGGADAETLAVHFEGAGELAAAGRYYSLAADEAIESLAFDRAVKLYRHSLDLGPVGLTDERRILSRLGDALANVGRSIEAANAYQKAAVHADQLEQTELQRRAAYQFLASGHIDEGLAAYGSILDPMGLSLPKTPRRALLRLYLSRARLALRGLRFTERAAAEVSAEKLELVDIFRSLALGISIVDVIRGADYQTRSLLLRSTPVSRCGSHSRWDGRRFTYPVRGGPVGDAPSTWSPPPASSRTGLDTLMHWAPPASPPVRPSF